jgi:hypothetical protein
MNTTKSLGESTAAYEAWVDRHTPTLAVARAQKHALMVGGPFPFMRATYYRWAAFAAELSTPPGPVVGAVGDLHVENFGTWRDAEGRLTWGVNDLDEADRLPAAFDLLRLATSVEIARSHAGLAVPGADVVGLMLEGYAKALRPQGLSMILERPGPLPIDRLLPTTHRQRWWDRLAALPVASDPPTRVVSLLIGSFPRAAGPLTVRRRIAGLGSRDHLRLAGVAELAGAPAVREVKALAPPATWWLAGRRGRVGALATEILARAPRSADPSLRLRGSWVIRRLAPWADRIEIADLRVRADIESLLVAMGAETANLHRATAEPAELMELTTKGSRRWLKVSTRQMVRATLDDAAAWQRLIARQPVRRAQEPAAPEHRRVAAARKG